jgi:hypothetical protein
MQSSIAVSDENMSRITPKPIIAHVVKTWKVPPGMTYALVEDMEQSVWVVQSCPAGTQFWTVAQAENLPSGRYTRKALREAIELGKARETLLAERKAALLAEKSRVRPALPPRYAPVASRRSVRTTKPVLTNTGKALVAV